MDISTMVTESIDRLSTLTVDATKRAAAGESSILKLNKGASTFLSFLTELSEDDKHSIIDAGVRVNAISEAERALQTLITESSASAGSDDRSEGDKLAAWLVSSIELAMIDGDDRERAESAVESWTATAPKRVRKHSTSGASTGNSALTEVLGFTVTVACDRCAFKASTTRNNLNSIRDQIKTHEVGKHGAKKDDLGRASTFHANVTEALDVVMHGDRLSVKPASVGWNITTHGKVNAPKPDADADANADASKAA